MRITNLTFATGLKALLLSGVTAFAFSLTETPANARTQAGLAAPHPNCLIDDFGAIANNCGSTQTIAYPAVTDATNTSYRVTVRAQGGSAASNVTCWVHGMTNDGTMFFQSNTESLPFFGPSADIPALNAFVPSNGVMIVRCTMLAGGSILSFRY